METEPRRQTPQKRRLPRQATAAYLENAALHYLERFASSSANLRRVLMRKVARSARAHGTDPAEGAGLVDAGLENGGGNPGDQLPLFHLGVEVRVQSQNVA